MKTIIFTLVSFLALTSLTIFYPDIVNDPNVQVLNIGHECNGNSNGFIELQVDNLGDYSIYWSDGSQEINLFDLSEGIYTLVLEDQYGCTFEFEYEILNLNADWPELNYIIDTDCNTMLSDITFQNDLSNYTFTWNHGSSLLNQVNLSSGTYILTLLQENGCTQDFEIEIFHFGEFCNFSADQIEGGCYETILVNPEINLPNGNYAYTIDVTWDDSPSTSLYRTFPRTNQAYEVCVNISTGLECCTFDECWTIEPPDVLCEGPGGKGMKLGATIIVNEWGSIPSHDGRTMEYVELLVTGDYECGGNSDIRGFSVDDNGGDFLIGNEEIEGFTKEKIGVNDNYMKFSENDMWSNIPNGSLIVFGINLK